jgi:hypothetical protein
MSSTLGTRLKADRMTPSGFLHATSNYPFYNRSAAPTQTSGLPDLAVSEAAIGELIDRTNIAKYGSAPAASAPAQLFCLVSGWSINTTDVPFLTLVPSNTASQFVNRTQPWDSALLTLEGLGVPWMPYPPSADSPIQ